MAEAWDGTGVDPWLPARLNARLEAAQVERDIRQAVWAELSAWLVQLSRRVLRGDGRPEVDAVWALAPRWRDAVAAIVRGEILKAVGLAFARILGPDYRFDQRTFVTAYLAEVTNRLVRLPEEVFDLIAGQVAAGVNLGEGIPQLAARVDSVLSIQPGSERWPNRATVVARTETIGALNAGRYDAFRAAAEAEPDTVFEKFWLATDDSRTRPTHHAAEGQRVPVGAPFVVGGFELRFPGDPSGPANEVINCVVGSTQVSWPRQQIWGSTRRRHFGPLVQLVTAEGHDLTVTPNHPVLTPEGYVPAGLLRPGHYVLGALESPTPEVDDVPTSAEEIHRALSKAREPQRVMSSRMDFHGDGSDGEVEIVGTDGYLPRWIAAAGRYLQEPIFVGLDDRERALSGTRNAVVARVPVTGASDGTFTHSLIGRGSEIAPLSGSQTGESKSIGVTASPDFQAQINQAPDDGRAAEADFPAHLQYALAVGMAPTKIVQVNRLAGDHFVYNLSTSDHWFTGNGIALHNCRCTMLLLEQGENVDMSNRQTRNAR